MQDYTSSNAQDNAIALQKFGVGQPVRRKEDDTLVRGKGKYTDDFSLPGQAYAWIVRSSHAHGIIRHQRKTNTGWNGDQCLYANGGGDTACKNFRVVAFVYEGREKYTAQWDEPTSVEPRRPKAE